jgi:hypothetical protein
VIGKGVRQVRRERADLTADAPEVVEQARAPGRKLRQELGEPQDIDTEDDNRAKIPPSGGSNSLETSRRRREGG